MLTRYGSGRMATDSSASISSEMRIAPSCAVKRQPACAAKANEASSGPSSRVVAKAEIAPVIGLSPSRFSEVWPWMPTVMPPKALRMTTTPMVPPPTTRLPLPQVTSVSRRQTSLGYCLSANGIEPTERRKKNT
ncbi:Uncharacterised protein [Mycobacteroides abscessus subsp. abscessus]|nr:Uncharacterised protein [Mycobacteroides abscessus subsp. abscessus]